MSAGITDPTTRSNLLPVGGGGTSQDEKPTGSTTLAKTFRTLRKRLSRTSNSTKHGSIVARVRASANEKDNAVKSGGDESEASSTGEDSTQLTFSEIPISNPDLTALPTKVGTATTLKVHRSAPADTTPTIVTSPPALESSDAVEKTDDSTSSAENAGLSKTWSSSAFTGAQLRGTCSLEYAEHMREKSHKRKAHVVDLRKDDAQFQQLTATTMASTSNHSTSTSFTSYRSHTLTVMPTKSALSYSSILSILLALTYWMGHVACAALVLGYCYPILFSLFLSCARYSLVDEDEWFEFRRLRFVFIIQLMLNIAPTEFSRLPVLRLSSLSPLSSSSNPHLLLLLQHLQRNDLRLRLTSILHSVSCSFDGRWANESPGEE